MINSIRPRIFKPKPQVRENHSNWATNFFLKIGGGGSGGEGIGEEAGGRRDGGGSRRRSQVLSYVVINHSHAHDAFLTSLSTYENMYSALSANGN